MLKDQFVKLDPSEWDSERLLHALERDAVLLCLSESRTGDRLQCIESYCYVRGTVRMYGAAHVLEQDGGRPFINIDSEWSDMLDDDEFTGCVSLGREGEHWYLSNDRGNWQGPLECDLAQAWLTEKPGRRL